MTSYRIVFRVVGGDVFDFTGIPARSRFLAERKALAMVGARRAGVVFCEVA